MRVAVIGGGYWGSKHVRVLSSIPEVDEVVLVDLDPERGRELKEAYPTIGYVSNLADAFDRADAFVIATPPQTHAPLGLACIEAGKHVLIEKPLATTTSDARALNAAASEAGLVLMVGHTFEYNPAVWQLRDTIQRGELGDVLYIDSARLNLGLYQTDVNVIWDLAPHDVSILNYLLDGHPTRVTTWGDCHVHPTLEDVATLRLEYGESGVRAQIRVSWLDPCKVRTTTVVGSRRMAVYDDVDADERLRIYDKGVDVLPSSSGGLHHLPLSYRNGDITSPFVNFREPLLLEDRDFVESIKTGLTPKADGESGLRVVAVLEAAIESLREGRPVDIASLGTSVLHGTSSATERR